LLYAFEGGTSFPIEWPFDRECENWIGSIKKLLAQGGQGGFFVLQGSATFAAQFYQRYD
jgi:hypothetical protein